jgi:hypothetical protein
MAGTHYILDRDRDDNKNPMELIKEKPCRTCKVTKPNTFQFFGKKLWKTRYTLTTNEVCIACQKAKVSATMKDRWRQRKTSDSAYEAEQLRMAQALVEENERRRIEAEARAAEESAVRGTLRMPIEEIYDIPAVDVVRPSDEDPRAGVPQETESERLMRELLSGS